MEVCELLWFFWEELMQLVPLFLEAAVQWAGTV